MYYDGDENKRCVITELMLPPPLKKTVYFYHSILAICIIRKNKNKGNKRQLVQRFLYKMVCLAQHGFNS
jgi:hypothetical protein